MNKTKRFALVLTTILSLFVLKLAHAQNYPYEVVAKLPAETPPGNIGIGPDGRIFLSVHKFYGQPLKMVELLPDGSTKPYPTEKWARAPQSANADGLYGVLGLNVDQQGVLWMLDTSGADRAGRLIGWNTRTESLDQIVYLPKPIIKENSFLNDLAVDLKHQSVYIADTGTASIIVVDLSTGRARRLLEGSDATSAEPVEMVIDDRHILLDGKPASLGINPITIDATNEWVYFGAMSGTAIYRIKTTDLLDASLSDDDLRQRVVKYGSKPISDGITVDDGGNVYITSITDDSIGVVGPDGKYQTLMQHDELSWTDGFAIGPDHQVYVTVNELHRSPVLNGGKNASRGEMKVIRFKSLKPAQTGR